LIKNIILNTLAICLLLLLSSCASRFNYEPDSNFVSDDDVVDSIDTDAYIVSLNSNGATLDDNRFITSKYIKKTNSHKFVTLKYKMPNGFYFLNYNQNTLLATNNKNELLIYNHKTKAKDIFNLNSKIIASSIKNNLVALVFSDNSIGVYDGAKQAFLLKEYLPSANLNSNKIASPLFYKNAIFFPSLDGKIVITTKNKVIEKINIAKGGITKNIIFLKRSKESLIVATKNQLFSLKVSKNKVDKLDINIKDIKLDNGFIYVASLQGDVFKLNYNLKKLRTKKFKFANFHNLIVGAKYIWVLEKNDFIIRIDKNFNSYKVFDFKFDDKEKTISLGNRLYYDDEMIILQ
jgi:outer membrane lipoprotein-sorting protein